MFSALALSIIQMNYYHLYKYTIMDDFKVTDMTGTHETILFYGDDTGKLVKELFNIDISGFSNNDFGIYIEDERHSNKLQKTMMLLAVFFLFMK